MKILMLNPPYFPMFSRASRSPAVTKSSTLYYPFFLAYATGVLEDNCFDVELVDAPAEGLDRQKTIEKIQQLKPTLVVCETSTPSIENDMEVISEIKKATATFIIAVGTHVSALPDETLKQNPSLDAIARHEYEYTIRDLATAIRENGIDTDLSIIDGLSFRKNGDIYHCPDRPFIENLDELPFVSKVYKKHLRHCMNSYFYGANLHPIAAILSGRGCPHMCAYCVYPQTMTGHRYRLRSVNNVVDELEYINKELPVIREVFIEDDTLTVDSRRAMAISQEIINRGLNIKWSTNSRADADFETMRLMHKAGCRLLCVGFESSSQEVLDKLHKHIKQDGYMKFRKDAARAGLLLHGCFMYGNEGETYQTMHQTLELAKRLNCDSSQFYPIMVYPGTRAYDDYKKKGFITAKRYRDWLTSEGLHNCVVSLPNISGQELVGFCDFSRRQFYLRPKYIFSKLTQIVTKPRETKRILRASTTLMKYTFRPSSNKRDFVKI
jgi:anaerobic magnesium-protoporphyrin IX monomethyl ester cyclase